MDIQVEYGDFWTVNNNGEVEHYPAKFFNYDLNDSINDNVSLVTGWFGRLNMPGYLDCTEWIGPFGSKDEATNHLVELVEFQIILVELQ